MPDVFISYSRKDRPFAERLHQALAERQRDTWIDWEDIPPTAEWLAEICAAIEASQAFVFVISPDSVSSDICKQELASAIAQNKRLIPIVCRDADSKDVPDALGQLNWIFFRDSDSFAPAVENLLRALDTDLDWVRLHTRLLVRAGEWEAKGRDKSLTLRGSDLKLAEQWLIQAGADKEPSPTPLHTEYVLVSRRTAVTRQRLVLAAVTVGLAVAIALAVVAFYQRQNAISRELAAHAASQLASDPELSVVLAREAAGVARTSQAEEVLRRALLGSHVRAALRGHTGWVKAAAFSPDGHSIVTASRDKTARVWDAAGHALRELRGHESEVIKAAFSPNGKWIATVGDDNTARVWDAASGALVTTFQGHRSAVNSAAFRPDSELIMTASDDELARIYACPECGSLDDLLSLANATVTRELTLEERQRYLAQ